MNAARQYIPRKPVEQEEEKPKKENNKDKGPTPPESPVIDERSLAASLTGMVSLAMSHRRESLREENYASDTDSSDWDSEGEN